MSRGTDITKFKKAYRTRNEGDFPDHLVLIMQKEWDLKYGENPNQHGAIYALHGVSRENKVVENARKMADLTNLMSVRGDGKGKGGLSLTNTMDISRAMDNLKYFDRPAVVIMKHNIVAGFAMQNRGENQPELFRLARDVDRRSNFGGTAVFNQPVAKETVQAIYELKGKSPFFVDVIASVGYEEGAVGELEKQSSAIRIAEFGGLDYLPKFEGDETYGLLSIKEMPGGRIGIQDIFLTRIKSVDDLITDPMIVKKGESYVVQRDPTDQEKRDLVTAHYLNISGARSNGVVCVKDGLLVAMGSGQVERVGAVEQMIIKGMQKAMDREGLNYSPLHGISGWDLLENNPFEGASVDSDAFYPFGDSLERLNHVGVTATSQPYGSINDYQVIETANNFKMAAPATLERCFGHF